MSLAADSLDSDRRAETPDLAAVMHGLGRAARSAARELAQSGAAARDGALRAAADRLRERRPEILAANAADCARAEARGITAAFLDRLRLDEDRVEAMASGLEAIAALDDPLGAVLAEWTRPNGLVISRVRVPIGVIAVIYESRPNVTADAAGLCLKAGNAAILRSGSESVESARAIGACLTEGLADAGLPQAAVQIVPTADRAAVGMMLAGLDGAVDVIVPRGGRNLVARVQDEARVPVFAHLEGVCHVYVDRAAEPQMAADIVVNSKLRRTGICGAAETLLIDRALPRDTAAMVITRLLEAGCAVRGDDEVQALDPRVAAATEADWPAEYLDAVIAARMVDGVDAAAAHIARYGSQHTDAIVTADEATARRFLETVDSAIVLHNASTQFADGGEFGMGAEIGIATGKMHARGPVGVEQLTTFKYVVRGSGHTRP